MGFWSGVKGFLVSALSEDGKPSFARTLSAWLSLSSMSLIWFIVRHAMYQPADKLAIWLSNLPLIIGALATFVVSPFGIQKITSIWNKKDKIADAVEKVEDKVQKKDDDKPACGSAGEKG